jgi:DNA-binding beta-propeller fold protein YncE
VRVFALSILVLIAFGCSGHGGSQISEGGSVLPQVSRARVSDVIPASIERLTRHGWLSKDATSGAPLVYASSFPACGGCVLVFRQDTGALVGVLVGPLGVPRGIATDRVGNLYVTNSNLNGFQVWIFPPGSTFPTSNPLYDPDDPVDVVVAADGTVYVSNSGPTAGIMVYKNGSNVPTSELFDVNAVTGYGIALDKLGNLYWGISTRTGDQIDRFAHGSGKPINTGIPLSDVPQSIAFDRQNDLVVSQPNVPAINIYELPNTLSGQFGQIGLPLGIAFNRFHSIFVAEGHGDSIEQFSYPGGTLIKKIQPPNFNPIGVAVYPKP